jgi:putative ABC transport system permease protein
LPQLQRGAPVGVSDRSQIVPELFDIRFALRLWVRHPTLIAVASLSLGLGVGVTTTMYSVLSRVAHYDFGFADEDRLVVLWNTNTEGGADQQPPTYDVVQALVQSGRSFEAFGLHQPAGIPVTLSGAGEAIRVSQSPVDVNGLSIVGVAPTLGRTYRLEDFNDIVKEKEARAIVISYNTWQRHFNGARDMIGQTIRVDAEPRIVIGVMPQDFALTPGLDDIAFWAASDLRKIPHARWMMAIGRLKPGVSPAAAEAEAIAVSRQLIEARGEKPGNLGARVLPIREALFGGAENALTFLLGTVSFVLLIGCANVANLLLAAGAARQKELALRAAVGAARRRLIRQLLTENLLLSLAGGVAGVVLAVLGTRLFPLIVPEEFPVFLRRPSIDARVLGFALGISVLSSVVFGLLPALRTSRVDLNEALKEGGRTGGFVRRRGRNALLVAEVSLSMVLLVGAGLMLRGLIAEQRKLPGFDPERLLTADILLGGPKYFSKTAHDTNLVTPQAEVFYDQLLDRVRALPGVTRAGIISRLPMNVWMHYFSVGGRPVPDEGRRLMADFVEADAQALETLGIRLLRGRSIEERDLASSPWVAVINQTFADKHFPGEDPIGQTIRVSIGWGGQPGTMEEPQQREIIGMAADVTYPSFFNQTPAVMYVPFRQHLREYGSEDQWLHTRKALIIRTAGDPLMLVRSVNDAVAQVDKDQTAHDFRTMEHRVASSPSVTNGRFLTSLFAVFGTLAVVLAMVGVYGVMSWVVGQRTREMGIRIALGARPAEVVRMLLAQSLRPIVLGVLLGVLGGIGLSRALNNLFWNMTAPEPAVLAAIAGLMIGAAVAAAWVPMYRVLRLDPQHVLRSE